MPHRKQNLLLQKGFGMNEFESLYSVIESRKNSTEEKSYTRYLFESGIDKILKKVGEESAETIIAAKNGDNELLCGEICDLLYHLFVLCSERGLPLEMIKAELKKRSEKSGNLKDMKKVDKNT